MITKVRLSIASPWVPSLGREGPLSNERACYNLYANKPINIS